ncbi:TerB family tellurite resistance protein [Hansschlegelia plantiphila]|uniref:Molecular chaperone DjlA n=1 Tax=Hansschlegelia plantiphila TaxID=374655 RepID=A0A9W6IY36_9HYPH|nr:TerB family tellurite resistance protein [Hansschlegelia plantiphila]GLK66832.1 molecular chaperone DjlA [Hansschlegelia plantiphila]
MSFWGKLAGAAGGFALGGPLGAIAGALVGHYLLDRETDPAAIAAEERDHKSLAFTIGVIALSAKMAKADGVVAPQEIEAFQKIFSIAEKDVHEVRHAFDVASKDVAGFDAYATQLAETFADEPATLEDVLHSLAQIAAADGAMHEAEIQYLEEVGRIFGLDRARFRRALGRYVQFPETDPYEVLGADAAASDEELKQRHRALVSENHPDRAMARGLPAEAVKIATSKLASINAAWDAIRAERGLA